MGVARFGHVVLGCAIAAAVPVAACGGGEGVQGQGPQVPSTTPGTGPEPAPTGTTPTPVSTGEPAPRGMKDLAPSAMAADLQEIGLDPKALPPLDKIAPDKLRKVMKTFTKALGMQCTGCHDANDFRAPTKNKKIAARMWSEYVRGLAMEDGSALYCDSCHQGAKEPLDRHDKKALAGWMDQNFVTKLKRVDGKDHSCETCHGEPFEPHALAQWTK